MSWSAQHSAAADSRKCAARSWASWIPAALTSASLAATLASPALTTTATALTAGTRGLKRLDSRIRLLADGLNRGCL